jgi:hypothetical protein
MTLDVMGGMADNHDKEGLLGEKPWASKLTVTI